MGRDPLLLPLRNSGVTLLRPFKDRRDIRVLHQRSEPGSLALVGHAVEKAQRDRHKPSRISIKNAAGASNRGVLASDAFFPFRDGIDEAGNAGVTAIIQPGGSMRDSEVIEAADGHGMAMIFTGLRHFKH